MPPESITLSVAEYEQLLLRLRSTRNKFFVHEEYVRVYGDSGALLLGFLINKFDFFFHKGKIRDGGWFYCTVDTVTKKLHYSRDAQLRIIKRLSRAGAISTKVMDCPPKRYFKIHPIAVETAAGVLAAKPNSRESATIDGRVDKTIDTRISPTILIESRTEEESRTQSRLKTATTERDDTPSLVVNTAQRENFLGVSPNQNTTCADRHVGWAKALRESFRANNIPVVNQRAVSSWAKEFQKLELAVGEAALAEVLAWYIPRVGKKFMPVAHSGKSFRVKFPQIKLAMERDKRDNPEVVLTAEMKALADNLVRDYRWPKGSDKLVHEAVARSWTALAAFRKKLLPLFESGTKTNAPQHAQFAAKCVRHELIIDSFVQRWMKALHAELVKWEQWSGSRQSFLNRAVDTDGDAFHKWGRGLAAKWGNSKIWDKLIEEVK